MRKYTLIEDSIVIHGEPIKKAMICELGKEVYTFLYTTEADWFSHHSERFDSVAEAELYCKNLGMSALNWIPVDDCLDWCNLDWIAPVRLKGRNTGQPNLEGIYEKFDGLNWVEFKPFE